MQRGPNNEELDPERKVEKTWCANVSDCTVGVSSPRNKTAFGESLVVTHAEEPDYTNVHIRDPVFVEKGVAKPAAAAQLRSAQESPR